MGEEKLVTPKKRDERIDAVKFWLIFLVITVHVIMRKEFSESSACVVLWNWSNFFVMPLFVFISGYLSRKKAKNNFWTSGLKMAEPLILFQIIALIFYVKHPLSVRSVLIPWYMLWYMLSLIYWRCILQAIPDKILKHKKAMLATVFCISLLAGYLPFNRTLSLQRTLAFMPFFFLGYYMKGRNLFLPDKYKPLCVVFLAMVLAVLFFYPHRITYLLNATPYKSIYGALIRMAAFAVTIPMALAFMSVCHKGSWFARQGRMSAQYYIYHALLIPPNSSVIIAPFFAIAIAMNIPMTIVTAVVIIMATTLLIAIALKIPYIKKLTNPSSLFAKKNTISSLTDNIHR